MISNYSFFKPRRIVILFLLIPSFTHIKLEGLFGVKDSKKTTYRMRTAQASSITVTDAKKLLEDSLKPPHLGRASQIMSLNKIPSVSSLQQSFTI